MQNLIFQIMNQFGYAGIFLLIAVENIFPPIPSEIILTFGGFLTTCTSMKAWWVVFFATLGSVAGAIALYGVGYLCSPERLEGLLSGRVGRVLHFKKGDIQSAAKWFDTRGKSSVFFCRCIPIVRSLISIPAGMSKMKIFSFLLMTTAGSFLWNVLLVFLGAFAGNSWDKIADNFSNFSDIILFIIILIIIIFIIIKIIKLLLNKKNIYKKNN